MLRTLLLDALSQQRDSEGAIDPPQERPASASARAATQWMGATPMERGEALRDLLELSDALPVPSRCGEIGFPKLRST